MKKLIIFLLIISCLCSCGYKQDTEKGIDLYGTYDTNPILIDYTVRQLNGVDIQVPHINGLKDTLVQDKINRDIAERVDEILTLFPDCKYSNYYTYANFANVISVSFYIGDDSNSERLFFNYNLIDGNPLKLEDLFVSDADILTLTRTAFYESMTLFNWYDMVSGTYSPDEAKLYKTVKNYINNPNKTFAFTPSEIYLYSEDYSATLKMIDIADDIVIYSKYITNENIYTDEYPNYKNIFTCANTQYDSFDKIQYGYLSENLWYDITAWGYSNDSTAEFEDFKEDIYNSVNSSLEEYINIAASNPDKFYILFIKPNISINFDSEYENGKWQYTYYDTANVNISTQLFEMPMEIYESVYKDKIIDTYRYQYFAMRGGAWLDTENLEGATLTEKNETSTYNYKTGLKED